MTGRTSAAPTSDGIAARLGGVHAATICPMTPDFAIDEAALAAHIRTVVEGTGIRGLLINGHAGENAQLSQAEKRRVTEIVKSVVAPEIFITSGVYSEMSLEAAEAAAAAEAAGADAILVFPPNGWALGPTIEAVVAHHRIIAEATGLPLLLYQAPVTAGQMAYSVDALTALAAIPSVVGVKEGSWEIATYEENRRALKAARPDCVVLGSGDEHLLAHYLIGTEGSQVSLAAITPELNVALWEATQAGDWVAARALHDRIYPLATAIYRQTPKGLATARLKACLEILGRLDHATMRPPIQPLDRAEYARLEAALRVAIADD